VKVTKKTPEFNITSEEDSLNEILDESMIEKPNPNVRGRASVSCDSSSVESFGSKEPESPEALVFSLSSSPSASSDESTVSHFMENSRTLSESNCEIGEAFEQSLLTLTPNSDFKSKHGVLNNEIIMKTLGKEEALLIVNPLS